MLVKAFDFWLDARSRASPQLRSSEPHLLLPAAGQYELQAHSMYFGHQGLLDEGAQFNQRQCYAESDYGILTVSCAISNRPL